ncbi:MAG: serine hydrolase [Bacteroidia bacterium]|nr:serine hydrolase [Bacteroidia bacterium]
MLRFAAVITSFLCLFNGLFFIAGDNKQAVIDPPFVKKSSKLLFGCRSLVTGKYHQQITIDQTSSPTHYPLTMSISPYSYRDSDHPNSNSSKWVDSVFNSLSDDERIAQMFMAAAYSNKDKTHEEQVAALIRDYKIGGMIMMQGGIIKHAKLVNYYQAISKVPLLISMDAEWGVSMRLDSAPGFPKQMALGAIQDDHLIYQAGEEIAHQCRRLGIHVNFAPVVDVNSNAANPVINFRAFGENKKNVARKGIQYMNALQKNGIIAVAKHFPGHGDTDSDSHFSLPVIKHNKTRIDSLELFPFRQLIANGVSGIMVAHLFIPALDSTPDQATTLSRKVVTGLLKDTMKFKGLVFTDALNMKGVSNFYKPEEIVLKAALAGNDILLFPDNIPQAINLIKSAIQKNEISQEEINSRCKKILRAKYWAGLNKRQSIKTDNLFEDINNTNALLLKRKLIENSLTLIKNDKGLVPFYRLDTLIFASVAIGEDKQPFGFAQGRQASNTFQETLRLYADIKNYTIPSDANAADFNKVADELKNYNTIFISIHNTNNSPAKNFGVSPEIIEFINKLSETKNVALDVFGNPYMLGKSFNLDKIKSILISYDDSEITQNLSAQLLFGGIPALGKLPVSITDKYRAGTGIILNLRIRFKYSVPEEVRANPKILSRADSVIVHAIREGAFPGCEVFGAKDGIVFYHKAFGHHTYDTARPVNISDIYDLASITKVASTTAALMKLYDEDKFDPDKKVSEYIPSLDSTDKNKIMAKEVLTHYARLTPFLVFWNKTVHKGHKWKEEIYSNSCSEKYPVKVADSLYIIKEYRDSMYHYIAKSKLNKKKKYKYSDVGMYWMHEIIEKQSGEKLNDFVSDNFYKPLGAFTMGYNPLDRFGKDRIAPTENDTAFRKQLIQGYVHDPGAAMLGGVAGHAGLFSNANDLAKLFQMFLNKGIYGGREYLKKETLEYFNTTPYLKKGNRRALGFDKPEPNRKKENPVYKCVSLKAFGHQGFTGTVVWADPDNNLLFVFLSNRVYPDAENKKIGKLAVRAKVQAIFYDAFK